MGSSSSDNPQRQQRQQPEGAAATRGGAAATTKTAVAGQADTALADGLFHAFDSLFFTAQTTPLATAVPCAPPPPGLTAHWASPTTIHIHSPNHPALSSPHLLVAACPTAVPSRQRHSHTSPPPHRTTPAHTTVAGPLTPGTCGHLSPPLPPPSHPCVRYVPTQCL